MAPHNCNDCGARIPAPYYLTTSDGRDLCVRRSCAQIKLDEAQDALRWRKWPEEKPQESGLYLTIFVFDDDAKFIEDDYYDIEAASGYNEGWANRELHKIKGLWWRPLGPLPGDE